MSAFSDVTYEDFKQAAAEFFRATENRSATETEEAVNGHKALTMMYVGQVNWTPRQDYEGLALLRMATERQIEVEVTP